MLAVPGCRQPHNALPDGTGRDGHRSAARAQECQRAHGLPCRAGEHDEKQGDEDGGVRRGRCIGGEERRELAEQERREEGHQCDEPGDESDGHPLAPAATRGEAGEIAQVARPWRQDGQELNGSAVNARG